MSQDGKTVFVGSEDNNLYAINTTPPPPPPPPANPFVFEFNTTACYHGNSHLSGVDCVADCVCQVGKLGSFVNIDVSPSSETVQIHYTGFPEAVLTVVSPESAFGYVIPSGATGTGDTVDFVATRVNNSADVLIVASVAHAATCTVHATVGWH